MKDKVIRWIATIVFALSSLYIAYYAYGLIKARQVNEGLQAVAPDYNAFIEGMATMVNENEEATAESITESVELGSSGVDETEETSNNVIEVEPLMMSEHMKMFYDVNPETVGWLCLSGTKINYPVVQTTDNDKYLHTNFFGEESQPGTLFVDYRCNLLTYPDKQSDNIIIYGHKQADGEMFGTLNRYQDDIEFYKKHPIFVFRNLYDVYLYKVVGAFICKANETSEIDENLFDYQNYINFAEEGRYSREEFLRKLDLYNQYDLPVDIKDSDKFITLSTCSYEYDGARFVLVGRRLRDDEYPGVNMDEVFANSDYLTY